MAMHGGRVVARALRQEGVSHVFTLCGGHIMSIYDGCLDEGIAIIDVRHEQSAAHVADGYFRASGKPLGVFTSVGPGACNTVVGVATAFVDSSAMVCTEGKLWYTS